MVQTWDARVAAVWADDSLTDEERIVLIDAIAAERAGDDPRALFERAGARDAAGLEREAESLYRAAIAAGLSGPELPQAVIQLASTLRNLGRVEEALDLLRPEYERGAAVELRDEVAAFYALTLVSAGQPDAAASVALATLAPHLTRYRPLGRGLRPGAHRAARSAYGEHERVARTPPVDSMSRNEHGSTHG